MFRRFAIGFVLALAAPAFAQAPPMTLDAALDEALARHPTLRLLRAQFEVARRRPAAERFLMPPTFEAQIWQWPLTSVNPLDTTMYMFMAGQEVSGRGKRAARAAVLEADAAVADSEVASRARAIVGEVKQTYAELYLARREVEIQHEALDLLRQLADLTEVRYAAGGAGQQDVLTAVVELSARHEDLVMAEERARVAEARLNALLDRPPDAPIGALAPPRAGVSLPPAEALQRLAVERHPELRTAALERQRGEAALAAARAEYAPDVMVGAGYMLMPRGRESWSAKVGITWPGAPWSRGRLDARAAEAAAEIDAAAARERVVEQAIRLAVQEAYVRVQSAERRAALLRTSVLPQTEHALEVARVAYQNDRAGVFALVDTQRALLEAQLAHDRALSDIEQAAADLERAVGVDLGSMPPGAVTLPRAIEEARR